VEPRRRWAGLPQPTWSDLLKCPVCESEVDDPGASSCPACENPLRGGATPYASYLEVLNGALSRVTRPGANLSADGVSSLYAHVAGALQQMLDTAREDIDRNFGRLAKLDLKSDPDIAALIDAFSGAQREIGEALGEFGRLLTSVRDPVELERNRGAFEMVKTRIQGAVDALSMLAVESADPALLTPAAEPLPPQVPVSLEAVAAAMQSLDQYITDRNTSAIAETLDWLERARVPLADLLSQLKAAEGAEQEMTSTRPANPENVTRTPPSGSAEAST